jgi:hypothetical protein
VDWTEIAKNFPYKALWQVSERWKAVLNPQVVRGSWTPEEDALIMEHVRKNGLKNWAPLSKVLPGRIGKQCRERWINHLDPRVNKSPWTPEEDAAIMRLRSQFGNCWVKIAAFMNGRSGNAVKNRWNSMIAKYETAMKETMITEFIAPMIKCHGRPCLPGMDPYNFRGKVASAYKAAQMRQRDRQSRSVHSSPAI